MVLFSYVLYNGLQSKNTLQYYSLYVEFLLLMLLLMSVVVQVHLITCTQLHHVNVFRVQFECKGLKKKNKMNVRKEEGQHLCKRCAFP